MPTNDFTLYTDTPSGPATNAFAITPHASNELDTVTKAIYVGIGGDITLRSMAGTVDVLLRNVAAGSIIDIRVLAVRVAGTTAGNIVGLA